MYKQLLIFIAFSLLIPLLGLSQSSNWLSTIDLNVIINNTGDRVDLYTDADGVHIIIQYSNQLNYSLFDPTGTLIRESVRDNNVSENPRLSRIVGWEGKLYIIYKEGNKIKTQQSTDAGATWSTTAVDEITMANSTSNGIDAWTDVDGVHLVYSEDDPYSSYYKTWYQLNEYDQSSWINEKEVTDLAGDTGGFPSVTTSANRVHVSFTAGDNQDPVGNFDLGKTRDLSGSTWQSSQKLSINIARSRIAVNSTKLHGFYYPIVFEEENHFYELYHKKRDFSASSWPEDSTLLATNTDPGASVVDIAVTENDDVHIAYYKGQYRIWNGSWSTAFTFSSDFFVVHQKIAANSNDIYVIWSNANTIKLRQRDFAPLAPTNLSRSIADPYGDRHPRIDWDANAEADLDEYEVWKKKGSGTWNLLATTSQTYYVDNSETGVSLYPYSNNVEIDFKLKAVDLQNNKSGYSETVTFNQRGGGFDKPGQDDPLLANNGAIPDQYQLAQNYPNPFNPATTISFALPEAHPTELRIYSMNGKKVITLVDQFLEAGIYHIQWDGRDADGQTVASGIYIYRLKSGQQRFTKKMMLLK